MQALLYFFLFITGGAIVFFYFKMRLKKSAIALDEKLDALIASKGNTASIKSTATVFSEFQSIENKMEKLINEINQQKTAPLNDNSNVKTEQLQKQLNNLFLVNELSQRITSSLSIEENFNHLYNTINSMMSAAALELVVYNEASDRRFYYSNKVYANFDSTELSFHNHMAEWCFKNDKEIFLEDAENDFGRYVFKPLMMPDEKVAQSVMGFPIHNQNRIAGTLCVICFQKNAFELFHKEMIRLLLPFIGVAINNAFNHQQIIDLKQRAERSEAFMGQFLANMSHEIRTPMNSVMGMTNLLLLKNPQPEQLKYLNTIQKSSENLLVILNDILDLSKIEAGKIELEQIDFSIRDVVNNVKDILQHKADEKQLQLHVTVEETIPDVLIGDPTRLTQILINLIGNAIKFTEKGLVTLNVIASEERAKQSVSGKEIASFLAITFRIQDTGIGMTTEQQKKLFEKFSQASGDTNRKYGGTGLGLSISKQLIELQGGTISVESEYGIGSTFSFSINYNVSNNVLAKELDSEINIAEELRGLKILLAEDNEFNRMVAAETLHLKIPEVEIVEAINGKEVLEILRQNSSLWGAGGAVILMDVNMPVMDGLEATWKIRNDFPTPINQIKILAFTASVIKSEIDKCYAAGADGFIPKPFKTNELLVEIYKHVRNANSINQPDIPSAIKISAQQKNKMVDLNSLKQFSEGDEERISRYINLFIEKTPTVISNLIAASNKNDYETIHIAAHSLKVQLQFIGIASAFQLAEIIENNCTTNTNLNQIPQLINDLKSVCNQAIEELKTIG